MKKAWMMSAAAMLMVGGLSAETIAGSEIRQQERIAQGVRSGALTPAETRLLETKEQALGHEIRHDRLTGGGLSPVERARIDRQQDRLSHQIYTLKHNGRVR